MDFQSQSNRRFVTIANSTMSYLDIGEGPVVVLCHAYLFDADMWQSQIESLSRQYRVIIPELWGHGKSGALPEGSRGLRDIALHNFALLDHLAVKNFALIGISVGGLCAAEMAMMSPGRVTGLALVNTHPGAEPKEAYERNMAMLDAIEAARAIPDSVVDTAISLFFSPETIKQSPALVRGFVDRLRSMSPERLVDSILPIGRLFFGRSDTMAELRRLKVPALVLAGERGISRAANDTRELAAALHCLCVELPGTADISTLEAPDEANSHLAAFLFQAKRPPAAMIHLTPWP
jgi:pimeloyl-ACP methyl ester carboxylesterase